MFKKALEIAEPTGAVGKSTALLANTVGRVGNLPVALLVGQEKARDWLSNYSKEDLEKEIAHLREDPRLKNTLVRLNHSDPVDSIRRLWKSENHPLLKGIGSLTAFPSALVTSKMRMNHYNPLTDTVELYSRVPEIAHHELGHARDINDAPIRTAAGMLAQNLLLPNVPGAPFSQYLETKANQEAEKGYKGDMREFRRRLWPARGTYWGALAGGLAMLSPDVRDAVGSFVNSGMGENPELGDHAARYLKAMAVGLTPVAAGALGGRAVAEARNLFDKDPHRMNKNASVYNNVGRLLFGKTFIPKPGNNESVMDAMERNHREIDSTNLGLNHLGAFLSGNPISASRDIGKAIYDPAFMASFDRTTGSPEEADDTVANLRKNLTKRAVERLKGGLGDNKADALFNKSELSKGVKHEMEHTRVRGIAKEIAKDHLSERKNYYSALDKSGLE